MISIVIVSDIKIYCEGLSHILQETNNINVLGSASSRDMAAILLAETSPEIVLLDMTMIDSGKLAQEISQGNKCTKIVALAVPYDEHNILQCAELGITAYVPREAHADELVTAVLGAAKGEYYCPPKIAACVIKKIQNIALCAKRKYLPSGEATPTIFPQTKDLQSRLTRREQQISSLLSKGLSNKQIARDLSIEVSTVKNHVHNLLVKLEVKSRSQAVSLLQGDPQRTQSEPMDLDPYMESFPQP